MIQTEQKDKEINEINIIFDDDVKVRHEELSHIELQSVVGNDYKIKEPEFVPIAVVNVDPMLQLGCDGDVKRQQVPDEVRMIHIIDMKNNPSDDQAIDKKSIKGIMTPEFIGAEYKKGSEDIKGIYERVLSLRRAKKKTLFDRYWDSGCGCCCALVTWLCVSLALIAVGSTLDTLGKINTLSTVGMISVGGSGLIFLIMFVIFLYFEKKYPALKERVIDLSGIMILVYSMNDISLITKKFRHYDKIEDIPDDIMFVCDSQKPELRTYVISNQMYRSYTLEIISRRVEGEDISKKTFERLSQNGISRLSVPLNRSPLSLGRTT